MNGTELIALLDEALITLEAARDELRDLDAAIGDGDLGITVTEGARAVRRDLGLLGNDPVPSVVLRQAAKSFANANPSTMAALVAAGLLAAARAIDGTSELDEVACLRILESATSAIRARGGAELGDKTILDALYPTIATLQSASGRDGVDGEHSSAVLAEMVGAAQQAVQDTKPLRSKRGRAAWVGDRSLGQADGGATAYLRLLQALQRAWPITAEMADGYGANT